MKNLISAGAFALFLCFSLINHTAEAQIITPGCNFTPVAKGCVGACGNPGVIEYKFGPLCSSLSGNFCVTNEFTNLCPSHDAIAYVFDDGNFVTSGNITALGSSLSFSAQCPSKITVVVLATPNGSGINCVQFGNLGFYLRKQ